MSLLIEKYAQVFDDNTELDYTTWFEDETPQEQLDLLDNLEVSHDVAIALVEAGQTNWQHLGWWPDVLGRLQWWIQDGQPERSLFVARWLLETNPSDSARLILEALVSGDIPEVMQGIGCRWPAPSEFYLQRLEWGMVPFAESAELGQELYLAKHFMRNGLWDVYESVRSSTDE